MSACYNGDGDRMFYLRKKNEDKDQNTKILKYLKRLKMALIQAMT